MKNDGIFIFMAAIFFIFIVFIMPSMCNNEWDGDYSNDMPSEVSTEHEAIDHRTTFKERNPGISPRAFRERIIRELDEAGFL